MSVTAEWVFAPPQEVEEPTPGEVYQVFSETELRRLMADVSWLNASERSFEFRENEEDAVYESRPWGRLRSRRSLSWARIGLGGLRPPSVD